MRRDRARAHRWLWSGVAILAVLGAATAGHAQNTNLELRELTGGPADPFARNVYLCPDCTLEQFLAVPLPGPNWEKNASEDNARLFLPDFATNDPPPPTPGTAISFDFVPEIPGDDHFLIAQVLSGALIGVGARGLMSTAQVARGTTLFYFPGSIVHKLTDDVGDEYVLFSMSEDKTTEFDPFVVDGLAGMSTPVGWSYSSEVLTDVLTVETPGGVASIFTVPGYWTWQKIVPEPSLALLVGLGLLALGAGRRTR